MTFIDAAYQVLKDFGQPMDYRDIYREVVRRDLWESKAKDPKSLDNSTYGTLIKAVWGGDPRVGRIGTGPLFFARSKSRVERL